MLRQVRGALKGIGAWFVIALLVLAFGLWGVPELRDFTQRPPLRVGETSYSSQSILNEFNRQVAQRRDESGGAFSRDDAIEAGLPDLVVSSLATRSVLKQEAENMGLAMPRRLVRDYLQEDERFQNPATGRFDRFSLQSILQANSLSVRQFEALLKEDMMRTQLVEAVSAGPGAPSEMARAMLAREIERRRVGYLTITDDMAGVPAEPTPEDLRAYYEANPSAFTAPEYRTFTAVILDYADFREGLEAPEEELRRLFEARRAQLYESPEKRTIYQITYDTESEAQAAASALRQGKPFEYIASEKGLTLNAVTFTEIERGDLLDPSVAEAAFAADLEEGGVTDPIKSLFGWTVVQLAGVTPPESRSFEEVREEIVTEYLEGDTRRRAFLVAARNPLCHCNPLAAAGGHSLRRQLPGRLLPRGPTSGRRHAHRTQARDDELSLGNGMAGALWPRAHPR